ncbi:CIC11C00000002514 [Sungouiella intermedia]|uniref:CIC11C00000002514 n=1 Tax=Sungouiella intermedia TaxID=45354 RepID=A0A1L0C6U7_9ASCO|nr:CIC11C00000002514 [[Candida] intermedia]
MFRSGVRFLGPLRCSLRPRFYSSQTTPVKKAHLGLKFVGGVTALATSLYFTNDTFHDGTKHLYLTSERVGVVTLATLKCFNIYKNVLLEQFPSEQDRQLALSAAHSKAAHITLKALEKNGGIYIKLGQHICALTYLLPKEWTTTMLPLQDRCPRSSMEEIQAMFKDDMGVDLMEYFSEFSAEPVGVASLAQVHIATLRNSGEKVAVKLQHPSLAEFVPLDIYLTQTVFSLMHKVFPEYPLTWLGDELQNSIYVELDFTNEAVNAQNTAENFKNMLNETALRIPQIVSAEKRIIIMEYVAGARLDDLDYMRKNKINPGQVSSCLSHIFNNMIFTPHVGLHCDPHGGNLAIRAVDKATSNNGHNFEIVLYDHGLYRYIPLQMKRDYSHFWLAILDNDVPKMKEYAQKFAGIEGDRKFRIFAAAITGRDPEIAMNMNIKKVRDDAEMVNIQSQLHSEDGVLEDLMEILSSMPRMVLLILKTNDLTRNLDETLENPLGPERTFLILANYCARAVYDESLETNSKLYRRYSFQWFSHNLTSWLSYQKRRSSLFFYDVYMFFLRRQTQIL